MPRILWGSRDNKISKSMPSEGAEFSPRLTSLETSRSASKDRPLQALADAPKDVRTPPSFSGPCLLKTLQKLGKWTSWSYVYRFMKASAHCLAWGKKLLGLGDTPSSKSECVLRNKLHNLTYPVILRILGFFSSSFRSFSRKIHHHHHHHPWLLSSPNITG